MKIENQQDFYSGVMFIGFGVLAIVVARDYAMGSAMRMGRALVRWRTCPDRFLTARR